MDNIRENLRRAQEAIARARELSSQLSSLCQNQRRSTDDLEELENVGEPGPSNTGTGNVSQQELTDHWTMERCRSHHDEDTDVHEEEPTVSGLNVDSTVSTLAPSVRVVAQQLASLQRKQNETLQQLLILRMQQLK